jgi:hypothetical protein
LLRLIACCWSRFLSHRSRYTVKGGRQIALTVAGKTYLDGTLGGAVDQDMAEMACTVHEENGSKGLEIQLEKQVPIQWRHCIEGEESDDEAAPAAAATPAAATPAASPAAAVQSEPRKASSIAFTDAAKKPPPPATRPPAAAAAAAAAESADGQGSSACMMCMAAGTVLGVVGYAVDHWQKNTL